MLKVVDMAERVFPMCLTDAKFKEIQAECLKMLYVHWRRATQIGENEFEHTFSDYVWVICKRTKQEVALSKRQSYCVQIDMATTEACCECKLFESNGIMCTHIINFYDNLNINETEKVYY